MELYQFIDKDNATREFGELENAKFECDKRIVLFPDVALFFVELDRPDSSASVTWRSVSWDGVRTSQGNA